MQLEELLGWGHIFLIEINNNIMPNFKENTGYKKILDSIKIHTQLLNQSMVK